MSRMRSMILFRTAKRIVLWAIVGMIAVVANGWLCSLLCSDYRGRTLYYQRALIGDWAWVLSVQGSWGHSIVGCNPRWMHISELDEFYHTRFAAKAAHMTQELSKWESLVSETDSTRHAVWGWPIQATYYVEELEEDAVFVRGGIIIPGAERYLTDLVTVPVALPMFIRPKQFAWSAALHGSILALIWYAWCGAAFAVRMRRRQHGRCVNCGYDLSMIESTKCPECGTGR